MPLYTCPVCLNEYSDEDAPGICRNIKQATRRKKVSGRFETLKFNVEQVAGEMETLATDKRLSKPERRTWQVMAARLRSAAR